MRAAQGEDGGWAFDGSTAAGAADSNTTALVIQALVAAGHGDDPMVDRALAFLSTLLVPDGGFAYGPADPLVADANSTALVLQALIAAGEDPASPEWGNAPLALALFQTPSGGLRYMATDEEPNLLATVQAIPAMEGLSLPVARICAEGEAPPRAVSSSNRRHDLALAPHSPLGADLPGGPAGRGAARASADSRRRELHHAGLVVRDAEGRMTYAWVPFAEEEIDGIALLRRSGIPVVTVGFGALGEGVCSIAGQGCGVAECRRNVCQGSAADAPYWQYFQQDRDDPAVWTWQPLGASSSTVEDGDVFGWSWTADDPALPALAAAGDRQTGRRRRRDRERAGLPHDSCPKA